MHTDTTRENPQAVAPQMPIPPRIWQPPRPANCA